MENKKTWRDGYYRILEIDPWLEPYRGDLEARMRRYDSVRSSLLGDEDIRAFANGYLYFGFHREEDGWVYREWAPGADDIHLMGDFNGWNGDSHPMTRLEGGIWEIRLAGRDALKHGQLVKALVTKDGVRTAHISPWIRRLFHSPDDDSFCGQIWEPDEPFAWTDDGWQGRGEAPLIYEAHVGMAQEDERVGTYREFTRNVLPRIKADGYNTIQLMGIMEHPYYASFGYQVSNFYAASGWYGEPEDLKELVNTAHGMGLRVLLDVVHSHASANVLEGLNMFDGTDCQFFHAGDKGWHPAWGTKLFDYSKHEVLHFLLSNLKFWQDEYHFDGFRFDGVTSMLYHDHGLGVAFDHYDRYFSMNTDVEAVTYLQLANELVHANDPRALTIAEDMSGMPGMCLPLDDGGIGFDFRLAMGMPDYWIRMMKTRDEDWNMFTMWHELTSRRYLEGNIAYCESHDQALVGDKTLIFYLADAEMYSGMNKEYRTPSMDRAIALHKMIRFVTLALGGEGYLNFMGNEFGHPEWIDFPRLGNGWSFKYARRQWHLVDDPALKYDWLQAFDRGMTALAAEYDIPGSGYAQSLWTDDQRKILAFSRGGLVFVFGFHPTYSEPAFTLPVNTCGPGRYQVIFSTDDADFGGDERISKDYIYETRQDEQYGSCFEIYVPARSAMVLKRLGDLPEAAGAEE